MLRSAGFALALAVLLAGPASGAMPAGATAVYSVQSSSENQTPPITRVRITAGAIQKTQGRAYQWWDMSVEERGGGAFGVRVLSQRVPMTSGGRGLGDVARYIYTSPSGECLEYADALSGRALLPDIPGFADGFFPVAFTQASYVDGFATSGKLLGHALARTNVRPDLPRLRFAHPLVLKLRSDLLIASQADTRDDRDESIPVDKRRDPPLTRQEYGELIAAGANYFHPPAKAAEWLRDRPVFYSGGADFPADYYRSNYMPGSMFMDEPGVRFGWNSTVLPGPPATPDVYANAIMMRIQQMELARNRAFPADALAVSGTLPAVFRPAPSWDTNLWTAYYQMAGGSAGLIYEGRYVTRGYGWDPEALLGKGLDGLAPLQQFDWFDSFLRGAARRFGRYWGVSVYPEGDKSLMAPALIRAYDQGARCLWFWNDRNLPYTWRLHVLRELQQHIRSHPRRPYPRAQTAIVLPAGYIWGESGIQPMERGQLSSGGASYGDIGAAALFYGILLSREHVQYDTLNDFPGLSRMAYKQLIFIRANAAVEFRPPRPGSKTPVRMRVTATRQKTSPHAPKNNVAAEYVIPIAGHIAVDGDLADWRGVKWIDISGAPHLFGDNYNVQLSMTVPENATVDAPMDFLGFTWDQINERYRKHYSLEGYHDDHVVVTAGTPESAAAQAGLREGDEILKINGRRVRWAFEVWGIVADLKKQPGKHLTLEVQRGGLDRWKGPGDLSGRFAIAWDSSCLYFAADVTDDVEAQTMPDADLWMNDSVQIGLDPALTGGNGYGEDGHEITFALRGGKPVAYRSAGRRGQPIGEMSGVKVAIRRLAGRTIYEAAIPVSALAPLAPGLLDRCGMDVVVNDSDDGQTRKCRLELDPGAMTAGKKPGEFSVFRFAKPSGPMPLSSALFWDKRAAGQGGSFQLTLEAAGPQGSRAVVRIRLESVDNPSARPAQATVSLRAGPRPAWFRLDVHPQAPPGIYRLDVTVIDKNGRISAQDSLPVYVYK